MHLTTKFGRRGLEPTYKGLKRCRGVNGGVVVNRLEPTYKGLKPLIGRTSNGWRSRLEPTDKGLKR